MKLFLTSLLVCAMAFVPVYNDPYFVVIIPSYNNHAWYKKNIDSVLMQKYPYYHAVYVNDCSTDRTGELVAAYLQKKDLHKRITLITNQQRVGALANIYREVYRCCDNQIVVLLDGDDWLAHDGVLQKLKEAYTQNDSWLVYSQFMQIPMNEYGWNRSFSKNEYQNPNIPRDYSPSHLRTFYAGLFKKIPQEDLLHNGAFYSMTWDMAIMLPMVEMASEGHVHFIPDVLYIYNHANPLSDHCVDAALQSRLCRIIRAKKKYEPLAQRPF